MTKPLLAILLLLPWLAQNVAAHSGGLDSNGCHAGSQPYHCHRSPSEMVGNRLRCDLGSKSKDCLEISGSKKGDKQTSKTNYSSLADTPNVPKLNRFTTVDDFKIKNLKCEDGKWAVDGINLASYQKRIDWTVFTVDPDGDPLETYNSVAVFQTMQRKQISLGLSCNIPFEDLTLRFR